MAGDDQKSRRSKLAIAAPGVVAFCFMLLHSRLPWPDRVVVGLVSGIAVEILALLGMVVCSFLALRVLGRATTDSERYIAPNEPLFLAGMFLATFVWIWWQYNREVVRDIATCAERLAKEEGGYDPREAVLECYRGAREDFRGDFD